MILLEDGNSYGALMILLLAISSQSTLRFENSLIIISISYFQGASAATFSFQRKVMALLCFLEVLLCHVSRHKLRNPVDCRPGYTSSRSQFMSKVTKNPAPYSHQYRNAS